jgi:hypothetical protein
LASDIALPRSEQDLAHISEPFMHESAFAVLAFMGSSDTMVTVTMQTLEEILPQVEASIGNHAPGLDWMEQYPTLWTSENDLKIDFWNGLVQFLSLEYWSRIWIFQEMVLAPYLFFIITNNGTATVLFFGALEKWCSLIDLVADGSLQRPQLSPRDFGHSQLDSTFPKLHYSAFGVFGKQA